MLERMKCRPGVLVSMEKFLLLCKIKLFDSYCYGWWLTASLLNIHNDMRRDTGRIFPRDRCDDWLVLIRD